MRRIAFLALALAAMLAFSAPVANAGNVNVLFDTWNDGGRASVYLYGQKETAYLGEMAVRAFEVDALGTQTENLIASGFAYCVDLPQPLHSGTNPGYQAQSPELATGGLETVWLMSNYSPGYNGLTDNASDISAALQLAIWEVVYDTWSPTQAYDLSKPHKWETNNFWVKSASSEVLSLANSYLAALGQAKLGGDFTSQAMAEADKFTSVVSPDRQDLIIGDPNASTNPSVPEPGSMLLLGSALFGVAATRRRRLAAWLKSRRDS